MRVLLLYCFWSHALCGCCCFFLSSISSLFYFILDDFSIYFCYLVVMSLPVRECVCVCMSVCAQQNDNNRRWRLRQRFKCVFIHQMPVVVRFTFNVFTNVNAINSSCVWIAGIRSSGRATMLVIHTQPQYKCKSKRNGKEEKGAKHNENKNIWTHDENKKMYFIILYGYRMCT